MKEQAGLSSNHEFSSAAARKVVAPWGVLPLTAALPQNEPDRLNALHRYGILETPPEGAFDHMAEIAAIFFPVPIAIVSLVEKDRIWFESPYGIENGTLEHANWLCASAIFLAVIYHLGDAARMEGAWA